MQQHLEENDKIAVWMLKSGKPNKRRAIKPAEMGVLAEKKKVCVIEKTEYKGNDDVTRNQNVIGNMLQALEDMDFLNPWRTHW